MGEESFYEFQVQGIPLSRSSARTPLRENLLLVLGDGLGHHRYYLRRPPRHGFEADRLIHYVHVHGVHAGGGRSAREKDADTRAFEKELSSVLGLKVEIKRGSGESGNLVIKFGNFDQLDYIRMRLVHRTNS